MQRTTCNSNRIVGWSDCRKWRTRTQSSDSIPGPATRSPPESHATTEAAAAGTLGSCFNNATSSIGLYWRFDDYLTSQYFLLGFKFHFHWNYDHVVLGYLQNINKVSVVLKCSSKICQTIPLIKISIVLKPFSIADCSRLSGISDILIATETFVPTKADAWGFTWLFDSEKKHGRFWLMSQK